MVTNLVNFADFVQRVRLLGYPPVSISLNPIAEASVLVGDNQQFLCSFLTKQQIGELVAEYPLDRDAYESRFDPPFDEEV